MSLHDAPLLRIAAPLILLANSGLAQEYALQLGPGAELEFPHDSIMHTGSTATIEGWLRPTNPVDSAFSFNRYLDGQEHKSLDVRSDGRISWLYAGSPWAHSPSPCVETAPGVFPFDGAFHHIAFVRRAAGTWELYLDGLSIVAGGPGTSLGNCCWLTCNVIEAAAPTRMVYSGTVGAWRVRSMRYSAVERYTSNFTPQQTWVADASTAMLLELNEGVGDLVIDSGPAAQAGRITGEYTWVSLADCNGNNVPDGDDIFNGTSLDDNANGIPDECECFAQNYCLTSPNTVGPGAVMGTAGIPSLSVNQFSLRAAGLPTGQPGVFYFGDFVQDPPIPFGNGWRCVGGNTARINPPIFVNAQGHAVRLLDFSRAPTNVFGIGQEWYFQFWYRDHPQVGATFNLTDGLAVTFCP